MSVPVSVPLVGSVWNDYKGNTTIYFDPETQMIYVKDISQSEEAEQKLIGYEKKIEKYWLFGWHEREVDDKTKPIYASTITYTYTKYTVDEFMANIKNILFDMLHFADWIRNQMDKPSSHVSTATIENTFTSYGYNSNTFSIDLNLEPLLGDLQGVHLDIGHDENMNITTLYAKLTAVKVLDVKLNATLKTHAEGSQKLEGTISAERSRTDYVSPSKA